MIDQISVQNVKFPDFSNYNIILTKSIKSNSIQIQENFFIVAQSKLFNEKFLKYNHVILNLKKNHVFTVFVGIRKAIRNLKQMRLIEKVAFILGNSCVWHSIFFHVASNICQCLQYSLLALKKSP